jgi:hypothetical protein
MEMTEEDYRRIDSLAKARALRQKPSKSQIKKAAKAQKALDRDFRARLRAEKKRIPLEQRSKVNWHAVPDELVVRESEYKESA